MSHIVKAGDKALIKINTVIPVPANGGFTTDPRMLEALIELVEEQNPGRIQIGERCAMGADTMQAMEVCGIVDVAKRAGVELCPFEHVPFDMYKIDRPISFNEFPVPRPVREADVYIGLPKIKVHVHTTFTGAMKLQFGDCRTITGWSNAIAMTSTPEDRQPDPRRQSDVVHHGFALCVPGQRPVQPVQRGSDQGLQYYFGLPRPGCRGHPPARR
jgi:hypothetical protein